MPEDIVSPLPREECRRLLAAHTDTGWALRGRNPVVGRIGATRLSLRKRIGYRNSFQTILTADMQDQRGQTHLRCRFAPHPLAVAIMAVWFAGVLIVASQVSIAALGEITANPRQAPPGAWVGLAAPLAMLAGGIALVALGRYLARNERAFLLAFLRTTLRTHPPDGREP